MNLPRLFAACTLASLALLSAAQADIPKKLRFATEGAFRPWNWTEPDGTLAGFEIELNKDLCARVNVECKMVAQAFDGIIPALNVGKFDAIMAGMSVTPKREEAVLFSMREYKTTEQHDLDLVAGRVDIVMASMAYLSTFKAKPGNEDVLVSGPRFQGGLLGKGSAIAFRKGATELKEKFDAAIRAANKYGTVKRLSNKYFGYDVTPR